MTKNEIWQAIELEHRSAKAAHPNWPDHIAACAGIVVEEAGELMQACLQKKYQRQLCSDGEHYKRMKLEAIQTAVAAIRFLEHLEPIN
jgi:NTP pyrophosphatase (non-canonical NTP hydrolase)